MKHIKELARHLGSVALGVVGFFAITLAIGLAAGVFSAIHQATGIGDHLGVLIVFGGPIAAVIVAQLLSRHERAS